MTKKKIEIKEYGLASLSSLIEILIENHENEVQNLEFDLLPPKAHTKMAFRTKGTFEDDPDFLDFL